MVYFKLLLNDKRLKADSIYPVVVRVTYQRKNTTFNTGIRIQADQWDVNSLQVRYQNPNAQIFNKAISEFYSRVQNIGFKLVDENDFSFALLKQRLEATDQPLSSKKATTFKIFTDQLITDMLSINQTGNAIVYRTASNRLLTYAQSPMLRFRDIDYKLLNGFKTRLIKDAVKQNTISNYFRTLRAIYNKAIKAKLIERAEYPFLDISVKAEKTAKRAMAIDELLAIMRITLEPRSPKWHARNYFLLSFSLIGASFTDLAYLRPTNLKKGRLTVCYGDVDHLIPGQTDQAIS
ncbi:hypothetical protein DYU05_19525 [Mucilaginibacter terrenus]|uniref:Site-specific integrase n=1 Tax=Mucilaginibacter terrenus TaxID=2482727 RepID=A0A3E2NJL5_9SPHI|nr:phage integrase SAM-like domain and Arm DNA-binding domain-containing protein [Mucilaginibacter terrenus]RFZ81179.1 hypothetical protein DYU05_19525 [Mucilaginibacter terrenus]